MIPKYGKCTGQPEYKNSNGIYIPINLKGLDTTKSAEVSPE